MSKGRLEAFSDGVIAIIITIIVLLIDLPGGDQWSDAKELLPLVFGYSLSFLIIGMRWSNHHHLMQIMTSVNGKIIWANLLYLFTLSFFPVVTGWIVKSGFTSVPTTVFALLNLVESFAYVLLEYTVVNSHDCVVVKETIRQSKKEIITIALEAGALIVSFVQPIHLLSYVLLILMSAMWIIPDIRIKKLHEQLSENTYNDICSNSLTEKGKDNK